MGLHLEVIKAESVKTAFKLSLGAPVYQVRVETRHVDRKSSHPLLVALPGPVVCSRVSVETWPDFLARQFLLV